MLRQIRPLWFIPFLLVLSFAAEVSAQIQSRPLKGLSDIPPVLTQAPEVKIDTEGYIPTVSVWHPSFETMCRDFGKRLGVESAEIHLAPKPLPPSRGRYQGDVWYIEVADKRIEVRAAELPKALRNIRGDATRTIYRGTCYLKDNYFYSKEHVVFVTSNVVEAKVLAAALQ